MTVENIINSVGVSDSLTKPIIGKKEQSESFADVLERIEKGIEEAESVPFRASRYLPFPKMAIVEKRPSCIICGMTISSEGTCMCSYPTVISRHGGVSLNHNTSAQIESSESAGKGKITQISETGEPQNTEKVKLRRRCLMCGSAVSDDGTCMCDTEKKDDKTSQTAVKVPKIQVSLSN